MTSTTGHNSLDILRLVAAALEHESAIPDEIPVKATVGKFGLMHPTKHALDHEASEMMLDWAEHGCPVDTGPDWSREQIEVALERGPRKSTFLPGAAEFLVLETKEKRQQLCQSDMVWRYFKNKLPPNLKYPQY